MGSRRAEEAAEGVYAAENEGALLFTLYSWIAGHGQPFFKDGGLGFSPDLLASYFDHWEELRLAGAALPGDRLDEQFGALELQPLARGVALSGTRDIPQIVQARQTLANANLPSDIQFVRNPTVPGVKSGNAPGANGLSISANCTNVPTAAAFLNFFSNAPKAAIAFQSANGVVVSKPGQEALLSDANTPDTVRASLLTLAGLVKDNDIAPATYPPGYQALQSILRRAYEGVALKGQKTDQAAAQFMTEAARALTFSETALAPPHAAMRRAGPTLTAHRDGSNGWSIDDAPWQGRAQAALSRERCRLPVSSAVAAGLLGMVAGPMATSFYLSFAGDGGCRKSPSMAWKTVERAFTIPRMWAAAQVTMTLCPHGRALRRRDCACPRASPEQGIELPPRLSRDFLSAVAHRRQRRDRPLVAPNLRSRERLARTALSGSSGSSMACPGSGRLRRHWEHSWRFRLGSSVRPWSFFSPALVAIPRMYYEAASIDGASQFQQLVYVTLPSLGPLILFNTVMAMIAAFQAFNSAYIISSGSGGPAELDAFLHALSVSTGIRSFRFRLCVRPWLDPDSGHCPGDVHPDRGNQAPRSLRRGRMSYSKSAVELPERAWASLSSRSVVQHPIFKHIVLVGAASVMFYPLAWMVSASFRPDVAINNYSLWPGHDFTINNYVRAWRGFGGVSFQNSAELIRRRCPERRRDGAIVRPGRLRLRADRLRIPARPVRAHAADTHGPVPRDSSFRNTSCSGNLAG